MKILSSLLKRLREANPGQQPDQVQQLIEAELSHDDIRVAIYTALRANRYRADGSYCYRSIEAVFDTWFVYQESDGDSIERLYRADYSINAAGNALIGVPVEVREECTYIVVSPEANDVEITEAAAGAAANGEIMSALHGDCMRLVESALPANGRSKIKLISTGWNHAQTNYYAEALLREYGAIAFPAGTQMFWNHPTITESIERVERDLTYLAARTLTAAEYLPSGPQGPGLYAESEVSDAYKNRVNDIYAWIGLSVYALGYGKPGEAEGITGTIVEKFYPSRLNTIDFVTVDGAGGAILQLFESASRAAIPVLKSAPPASYPKEQIQESTGENGMTPAEIQAMQDENKRFKEAQQRTDAAAAARPVISEALGKIEMPVASRSRLTESLATTAPLTGEGKLDTTALAAAVQEAATAELQYLQEATNYGTGQIRGLGASNSVQESAKPATPPGIAATRAAMGL